MITRNDLLSKINGLIEYCKTNRDPNISGDFDAFMQPLITAINNYYDSPPNGLKRAMVKLITQIDIDIVKRHTTYEHEFGNPLPTNYPYGYDDFTIIFNGDGAFTNIESVDPSSFLQDFPIVVDETNPNLKHYETNPNIESLSTAISHNGEISDLENIIDFCQNGTYNDGLIDMFEDRGNITVNISIQELAHDIYIDRGAKEIINEFGIDVYIPSYI